MQHYTMRKAFTMIELLFVIVIMGIVGGITLEAIRQYYEGIYRMQEYSKRVADADQILEKLSKYFENAISSSIVNLDRNGGTGCEGPPDNNNPDDDFTVAFIGVDTDSLRGIGLTPGWNEEVLLGANNVVIATDSDYTMAGSIINKLDSASPADLTGSALYDADSIDVGSCARFGLNGGDVGSAGYHRITASTATSLALNLENNATDGKRKYLLRTGYAFLVQNDGRFIMSTNFHPWNGERYDSAANRKESLLGENVAHFYADYDASDFVRDPDVSDRGLVWRLKVCMRGLDSNLTTTDEENTMICRERRVHVRY